MRIIAAGAAYCGWYLRIIIMAGDKACVQVFRILIAR